MKIKKFFWVIAIGILASSCSYSKEQSTDTVTNNSILSKNNVTVCDIKQININFCKDEKISIYNKHLNDKPNFSKELILIVMDQDRDTGKGVERNVKSIIVLDPVNKRVIPFPQVVGNFVDDRLQVLENEPPIIKFSKSNNKVCISGTTYSTEDNNINVEDECYKLENGRFYKNTNTQVSLENTPEDKVIYNSESHFKCLDDSKLKECSGLNLQSTSEMVKNFDFINPSDGATVVINRNNFDLLISPFEDESGHNLRVMKVKDNKLIEEKFIYAGKKVEFNSNLQMTYYEGNKKKIIQY
ncbi:hypothetical protein [Acinetobacter sp. YH12049]|uniref:hypothetical protein n=1 Tax=Acinetobacter sp. YH12049 TaxID=2601054 RepID=UPI0015D3CDFE|nr:hypothetical protein [Acinetobacter sp. YH12049]